MVTQELAQTVIRERKLEVDRLQLEHQPQPDIRFLTSAARVLAAVIQEPDATMRDLARRCDRTERAVWQHLQELERAGLLRHQRRGRRNHYEVDSSAVERQLMLESAPLLAVAAGPGTN